MQTIEAINPKNALCDRKVWLSSSKTGRFIAGFDPLLSDSQLPVSQKAQARLDRFF